MFSSFPKEVSFERTINAGTKHWLLLTINKILILQVTSLLDHLIQLSKTGFSKATQRLDGIYAFFAVLRLAAVDTKAGFLLFRVLSKCQVLYMQVHFFHKYGFDEYADGTVLEKLWPLIAQNEPSLISLQLVILLLFEFPSRLVCYPAK